MTLKEWIDSRGVSRAQAYLELAEATCEPGRMPVSTHTIGAVDRGMKLRSYDRAKSLSEATGGAVSIKELCE